eukprot:tig00020553_g10506.t1
MTAQNAGPVAPAAAMFGSPLKDLKTTLKAPEGKFRLREAVTHPLGARTADIGKRAPKLTFAPSRRKDAAKPEPQVVPFDAKQRADGDDDDLASAPKDDAYVLVNVGDTLYFQDYGDLEGQSPMEQLKFRAPPTCHEANALTASPERLDVVIGFASGDIVVHDPMRRDSTKMAYYNKDGAVSGARVNAVRWLPRSAGQFLAAMGDGSLLLYDRDKEDGGLQAPQREPEGFHVQRNPKARANPVARWRLSRAAVHDAAFSPDGQLLATASRDGYLRVFSFEEEALLYSFKSYYGGLLCLAWSPDAKYILTGGEDDMCSVWSTAEHALVCRCEGAPQRRAKPHDRHRSFVHAVAWDPWASDPPRDLYRFASAGQDGRLCLWDLSLPNLQVPLPKRAPSARPAKAQHAPPLNAPSSVPSSPSGSHKNSGEKHHLAAAATAPAPAQGVPGRAEVPVLHPVVNAEVHHEPATAVAFLPHSLATASAGGQVPAPGGGEG